MSEKEVPHTVAAAELAGRLQEFLGRYYRRVQVRDLRPMAGGAHRQTWAFDALVEDGEGERLLRLGYRRGAPPWGVPGPANRAQPWLKTRFINIGLKAG